MKPFTLCSLLFLAVMLSSCTSFEKEWNAAVADYQSGAVKTPEGPWTGTWTTTSNGHTGDLRAIVKESPKKPGEYQFRYHATWAKIFSGSYTVSFPARKQGNSVAVDGEKKLGAFGTFGHKGKITGNRFDATFSSEKGDIGVFEMKRP